LGLSFTFESLLILGGTHLSEACFFFDDI